MRRSLLQLPLRFLAIAGLLAGSLAIEAPVAAATLAATTTCGNSADNTGGLGVICEVIIENTITASGGSANVTVRECHGAAGDPQASCTTESRSLTEPVTAVDQCNDAENGGGGTVRCSVQIINAYVADPEPVGVTVNQCVGSGDGITVGCDPFPATTTGATVTQCNGSANGGTLVGLTCTATGTESASFTIAVNQCNGTGNGGGSLVICSTRIDSTFTAPTPAPTATPTATASTTPTASSQTTPMASPRTRAAPTPPATDVAAPVPNRPSSGISATSVALFVAAAALVSICLGRRRASARVPQA